MRQAVRVLRMLLLAVAVALAMADGALAQAPPPAEPSPEALEAAKGLVALLSRTTIPQMKENIVAKVWPQIEAALQRQYPKIDGATLAELRSTYDHLMDEIVTAATADAPAIYARFFTAAEMNDIAAFYRTPTGAKALTVMPKAMAEMMPNLLTRMQSIRGELDAAFTGILKKHGYNAQ